MKQIFEVIIFGRAGQGAKTFAQMVAEGALLEGKEIQAFPEFGAERRGAPVRSFLRISDIRIRTHEPIVNPDVVIVLDDRLFFSIPGLGNYNCSYIINSNKSKEFFEKKIKTKNPIYLVDANRIITQENIDSPNVVLIGTLISLFDVVDYESIEKAISLELKKKGKINLIESNLKCLRRGNHYF
ncbi:MAG TPA: 2-oxoacid:acceptor oxidoreductase family protein [archaeon]|jgi:pyruvate ferredoxin oxidoreductase gamma subunit|nr:2-oxoacid:acceptor oxidoreductase family protein [archaeon]